MAPGNRFSCPGKYIFSSFMISGVFLRGQKTLEEATSGKGPQVALFPFHRRLQPFLGIPLDVIWPSIFFLIHHPPKSYLLHQVPSKRSKFTSQRLPFLHQLLIRTFLFCPKTFFDCIYFILCWFITEIVYFESPFGPSGRPRSLILRPFSPKVMVCCPPVRWVTVQVVFFLSTSLVSNGE